MSRDDGFAIADIDVGILDDPKVRRLMRLTQDEAVLCRALIGYMATVVASWGHGERQTIEEAAPIWLTDIGLLHGRLVSVDLLDEDGRVPAAAWEGWFTPAWDRRERRRQSGALGGRTGGKGRPKPDSGDAQASPNPSGPSGPDRPLPSVDTPQPPASGGPEASPRANGTNPRAVAASRAAVDVNAGRARSYRLQQRQLAQYSGLITEEERLRMNNADAPLTDIPGWAERQAASAAEMAL